MSASSTGQRPTGDELRAHLRSLLPDYMVPSTMAVLEAWPLTSNGKIDHGALAAMDDGSAAGGDRIAPRTDAERTVAAVWREVLGVDGIGIHDNFFDRGGHSLLVPQVHRRLHALDATLSIVDLFRYPTVQTLAERLGTPANGGGNGGANGDGLGAHARRAQLRQSRRRGARDLDKATS